MKIVFLCKRRYMSKDVIVDRYARLYEIPHKLAELGNEVECFCFSYQTDADSGVWDHSVERGRLVWRSNYGHGVLPIRFLRHLISLDSFLADFKPDIIFAASDIPNVVVGRLMAYRHKALFVADLYDNFESFGQGRIPGFRAAFRWAVRKANIVTCVSQPLTELVQEGYKARGKALFVPSTIDRDVFKNLPKSEARAELGLPAEAKLVGTAGALYREKGIADLFGAWDTLKLDKELHLVLAGPQDGSIPLPEGDRVHYLGSISHKQVATLFSALDVGVMCIPDDLFGKYCFPQKAYEMLACGLPVVASEVGAVASLLEDFPATLYQYGDSTSLAFAIRLQLENRQVVELPIKDWRSVVAEIDAEIRSALYC